MPAPIDKVCDASLPGTSASASSGRTHLLFVVRRPQHPGQPPMQCFLPRPIVETMQQLCNTVTPSMCLKKCRRVCLGRTLSPITPSAAHHTHFSFTAAISKYSLSSAQRSYFYI